ncbi:MAG: Gfo/Idh/MocA family oxidoreductase [Eubacteriales bacterium]
MMNMEGKVLFSSFNHQSISRIKDIDPKLRTGLLYGNDTKCPVKKAKELQLEAVHLSMHQLQSETIVAEAKLSHRAIHVWNVDAEEQVIECIKRKVDAIITNYPDQARKMIDHYEYDLIEEHIEARMENGMKKVITYGTFDLFHEGHKRILERAKALGDYLIVGVTTEYYDESRGKLNVVDSLLKRIENVKACGFVDEIIIEDHQGQKLEDILKYNIDVFTLGSDWVGKFDYLKDYCEVTYLERTKDVSSTELRGDKYQVITVGVVGTGRIAWRFVEESKFVSGITPTVVYNPNETSAKKFASTYNLDYTMSKEAFYERVSAVYVAAPHEYHYEYVKEALSQGKHVLCEKPFVLQLEQAKELYTYAREQGLVLFEGIKIAYAPGFLQMLRMIRSGVIGNVRDVEAAFTKLVDPTLREMTTVSCGGSFTELASYTLLPMVKLLGTEYEEVRFEQFTNELGIDIYAKAYFKYKNALATSKTGLGVKSDGQLLISGTKGYIQAKSPWWLMKEFEVCYEDSTKNELYKTKFLGSGLRYEISDFVSRINGYSKELERLSEEESCAIIGIMEKFLEARH